MTINVIIIVCVLLLLAYVFDLSSTKTKIPSVILLLLLGWLVARLAEIVHLPVPDLNPLLPALGTIGLILIVLEGSLELEFNASRLPLIGRAFINAVVPLFILSFALAWVFSFVGHVSYNTALVNTVPFCIISSAIAIPSVRMLSAHKREFVIYESSFSDIVGVLFFNFILLNDTIDAGSFWEFLVQLLLIILISAVAVVGLSYLLNKLNHHITYTPIILMVILIYSVSKLYHLPGLIFILVFGLFLGNLDRIQQFKWLAYFHYDKLNKEVDKFKDITIEATFLVRSLFFILFGFLLNTNEIFDLNTLPWAVGIVCSFIALRWIVLKLTRQKIKPLLFVIPRGLITILLFLSILPEQRIPMINNALIIQIILLTVLVMMMGLVTGKKHDAKV